MASCCAGDKTYSNPKNEARGIVGLSLVVSEHITSEGGYLGACGD